MSCDPGFREKCVVLFSVSVLLSSFPVVVLWSSVESVPCDHSESVVVLFSVSVPILAVVCLVCKHTFLFLLV